MKRCITCGRLLSESDVSCCGWCEKIGMDGMVDVGWELGVL